MWGTMNVSMDITKTAGISEVGRSRLGQLVRAIPGPIRVADAARVLGLDPKRTTWLLSAWVRRGWLQRLARGVYVPVSIETQAGTRPAADPWAVAAAVFEPCYMTGWSAAGHWDLTEQLYRVSAVVSARRLRNRQPTAGGAEFLVITRPLPAEGRVAVWREGVRVEVADPALTVVDILDEPRLGPGIREASRTISAYLRSERRDDAALISYGDARGNGAVFKRLGLLVEKLAPNEVDLLGACRDRLTEGYPRLDPGVDAPGTRRKRWRLIENVRIPQDERA
jgi:predicted transcriptional regulator of viral defense system